MRTCSWKLDFKKCISCFFISSASIVYVYLIGMKWNFYFLLVLYLASCGYFSDWLGGIHDRKIWLWELKIKIVYFNSDDKDGLYRNDFAVLHGYIDWLLKFYRLKEKCIGKQMIVKEVEPLKCSFFFYFLAY